jgi:hypothetical protein
MELHPVGTGGIIQSTGHYSFALQTARGLSVLRKGALERGMAHHSATGARLKSLFENLVW